MRRFNPEKELKKIQIGNKNKVIFGVIALLLIISIGSTYALYQVRYSKRIIYTKVAPFSNKDINILAVYIDNAPANDFPTSDQNYVYEKIDCDNKNAVAYWDYDKWALVLETDKKTKCSVYFKTSTDKSGANPPELYQGLIPVTIENNGTIKVANTNNEWYNYDSKRWANAVLVSSENYSKYVKDGEYQNSTEIPIDEILQMYVWIPRFKYKLFSNSVQMIDVKFESGKQSSGEVSCLINEKGQESCSKATVGNWYTHPAFKFGDTDLTGFWVGKFEPSDPNDPTGYTSNEISEVTIVPNKISIVSKNINTMFTASRNIESNEKFGLSSEQVDTHMMKNQEWGAVAYLSQSIYGIYNDDGSCSIEGCRIYINNTNNGGNRSTYRGTVTGCAGDSADATIIYNSSSCPNNAWNTDKGKNASTTGNIWGVYDMSGGSYKYLASVGGDNGNYNPGSSGLTPAPLAKYYEKYAGTGYLGDATRETSGWNSDWAAFPPAGGWIHRGGTYDGEIRGGIFGYGVNSGTAVSWCSFSVVITAQDGVVADN